MTERTLVENLRRGTPLENKAADTIEAQAADVARLRAELDYAYRCVSSGYHQGVFDFSVLKERSLAHMATVTKAKERAPGTDPRTGEYSTAQMMLDEMTMGDTSQPLFD